MKKIAGVGVSEKIRNLHYLHFKAGGKKQEVVA